MEIDGRLCFIYILSFNSLGTKFDWSTKLPQIKVWVQTSKFSIKIKTNIFFNENKIKQKVNLSSSFFAFDHKSQMPSSTPILYALLGMISTPMNLPQPLKAPMHDAWTSASALQLLQYILSSSATFFFYKIYHYRES